MNFETNPHYIILDFETNGLNPESDEIIEIGAIKMRGFEILERYHTLVKPLNPIPKTIEDLTGISNEMVADARSIEKVIPEFAKFAEDLPFVAHNSSMEQGFLDHHMTPRLHGQVFEVHNSIDPIALILPESPSYSLEYLREWSGVDFENAHRADKDCEDLLKVLQKVHHYLQSERAWIAASVDLLYKDSWWKWFFDQAYNLLEIKPTLLELMTKESEGDLRDYRKKDEEKNFPEKLEAPLKLVESLLTPEKPNEGFEKRDAQIEMAKRVSQALSLGQRIAIEAPTGTGKSMAYLIPGVLAHEKQKIPLVISTHSKNLQDQLLEKDVPLLNQILKNEGKKPIEAISVKGQENYVCLRKLYQELTHFHLKESENPVEDQFCATYLLNFIKVNRIAELDKVSSYLKRVHPELERWCERIKSHFSTTKGPPCSFYKSCHFFNNARIAHRADVLIANHSLVFHWPDHLPSIRNIVFDEAHHLEDQLTDSSALELKELELSDTIERLKLKKGKKWSDGTKMNSLFKLITLPKGLQGELEFEDYLKPLEEKAKTLSKEIQSLFAKLNKKDVSGFEDHYDISDIQKFKPLTSALDTLKNQLNSLSNFLVKTSELLKESPYKTDPQVDLIQMYAIRVEAQIQVLESLINENSETLKTQKLIYWNPKESIWRLRVTPIEVKELGENFFAETRSAILTSATLSSGENPTWVTDRIGVKLDQPFISLPSPFRLKDQAQVLIPQDINQPGTPIHLDQLVQFTFETVKALNGRTLLLMTANHRLRLAAESLREKLKPYGIEVYDSLSDRRAVESFKLNPKSLLIGGERYGEGVDLPGAQLSCVIIEKINEAMTRGPLAEVRKAKTRFGLYDYDFPLRMIWLKQRVGRLIRSKSDRGAVVIFDPRYHAWGAGSQNWVKTALSPMQVKGGTRDTILNQIEDMKL